MKILVSSTLVLVLLATVSLSRAAEQPATGGNKSLAGQTLAALSGSSNGATVAIAQPEARQGKSIDTSNGNALSYNTNGNSNFIEHSSSKSRIEHERRQVQEFLTFKNVYKSVVKLLFGNPQEISATSRHVLGILGKVLDLFKSSLGQKMRNGAARTIRDSAEDAVNAGVSMLQGYVKAVLAKDDRCVQRYLCQASKEATRDGRDLGWLIASVGGYASSYLLDNSKSGNLKSFQEASNRGRGMNEDCTKLYSDCVE